MRVKYQGQSCSRTFNVRDSRDSERFWSARVKLNCLETTLICEFLDFIKLKNCRWWIQISQSYFFNISPFSKQAQFKKFSEILKILVFKTSPGLMLASLFVRYKPNNWISIIIEREFKISSDQIFFIACEFFNDFETLKNCRWWKILIIFYISQIIWLAPFYPYYVSRIIWLI